MQFSTVEISENKRIRRTRKLSSPGKLLVRKGELVGANDILAECFSGWEHRTLNIARGLGIPKSKANDHINFQEGARVQKGNVIAGPYGFAKRTIRSPVDGSIVDVNEGMVMLRTYGKQIVLKSGISGRVVSLIPERGVVIESTGSVVQGAWGNGLISGGDLDASIENGQNTLSLSNLPENLMKKVISAGYCWQKEVIQRASESGLGGLILGSAAPELLPVLCETPFAVVILEGFGKIPINSHANNILTRYVGCAVELNGEPWDRQRGVRPEVFIPFDSEEISTETEREPVFEKGQLVRVVSKPHKGRVGKINRLLGFTRLLNGIIAETAEVQLDHQSRAIIPVRNLEFIY